MSGTDTNDERITAKGIILLLRSYGREIRRRWRVILFVFSLLGSVKLVEVLRTEPSYMAELTFMINEENGGVGGGLGSLLGDIGLGGGKEYNYQKLIALSKSRKIFNQVVFDTVVLKGRPVLLANVLIRDFEDFGRWGKRDWYKVWAEDHPLKGYVFQNADISSLDRLGRSALLTLHLFVHSALKVTADEDTGILTLKATLHDEDLTQVLTNRFFDELSNFYVEQTIEKQAATYRLLQEKVDSIQGVISRKEYQIAAYGDAHRNVWSQQAKVPQSKLKKEVHLLYVMLGEAVKNKELADFTLNNKTPFIQSVDRPVQPLVSLQPSLWMEIFRALLISILLGGGYIAGMKWYREVVNS